jgi:hypothetical protein
MVESSRSRKRAGSLLLREVRFDKRRGQPSSFSFVGAVSPEPIGPVKNDGSEFPVSISYVAKSRVSQPGSGSV